MKIPNFIYKVKEVAQQAYTTVQEWVNSYKPEASMQSVTSIISFPHEEFSLEKSKKDIEKYIRKCFININELQKKESNIENLSLLIYSDIEVKNIIGELNDIINSLQSRKLTREDEEKITKLVVRVRNLENKLANYLIKNK